MKFRVRIQTACGCKKEWVQGHWPGYVIEIPIPVTVRPIAGVEDMKDLALDAHRVRRFELVDHYENSMDYEEVVK